MDYTVTGLDGWVNYTVTVVAVNGADKSQPSLPVSDRTLIKGMSIVILDTNRYEYNGIIASNKLLERIV